MIVVGTGLVAMSAAVLVLRNMLDRPAAVAPTADAAVPARVGDLARGSQEVQPVANAIVDAEVAKAAERRAILS